MGKTIVQAAHLNGEPQSGKFQPPEPRGTITVPENFRQGSWLNAFRKGNNGRFYFFSGEITNKKQPQPGCILKPGDG